MKWLAIVGVVVIIVATITFYLIPSRPQVETTIRTTTPSLPVASDAQPTLVVAGTSGETAQAGRVTLATLTGESIIAKDFIRNGETVVDTVNPNHYVLAGSLGYCLADGSCPAGASTKDFTISYNDKTQVFSVALLTEPIGLARSAAEQFLSDRLGLADQQLCSLSYFVGTPYWVNSTYDDRNLGFSFCPGATVLPQ